MVFVIQMQCFLCEIGTEFVNTIYILGFKESIYIYGLFIVSSIYIKEAWSIWQLDVGITEEELVEAKEV